jgi:hypothetical protein
MIDNDLVLSVPAGKSYALVLKHHIYSCPASYQYESTTFITFRTAPPSSQMEKVFRIRKVIQIDPTQAESGWEAEEYTKTQIAAYITAAQQTGVLKKRGQYKFYILDVHTALTLSPPVVSPANTLGANYYSLTDLQSGIPTVQPCREMTYQEKLRTPQWRQKREKILAARGNKCELCGSSENLTIHHGYYAFKTKPWELEDYTLWVLCWPCHEKTQRLVVAIHYAIGCVHPKDLPELRAQVDVASSTIRIGISDEEAEAILREDRLIESSLYSEYTAVVFANSDLGPSIAEDVATMAAKQFPGLQVSVTETCEARDGTSTVEGPEATIVKEIELYISRKQQER